MFFSRPKSYLGIDLGAGGIKVVELREEKKRPVLFTYGFTSDHYDIHHSSSFLRHLAHENTETNAMSGKDSEQRIEEYASTVRALLRQTKTVSKIVTASLPASAVFQAVVTLPLVKTEELLPLINAEVKKLSSRPSSEMTIDYTVVEKNTERKTQRVLVSAVPREVVSFYSRVFQRAGLTLDSLEPEATALSRALIGRDASISMVIDIGFEQTNFFIVDRGVPTTHHSMEAGGSSMNRLLQSKLGLDEAFIDQVKYDLGQYTARASNVEDQEKFIDVLHTVLDPIIKEIRYSLDVYLRQTGNEDTILEKIVLTGGASLIPYLADHVAEQFAVKCYVGDPWARVVYQDGLRPVLTDIGPRMAVAIGLALRKVIV